MTAVMPYRFDVQMAKGQRGEAVLDAYFARWFDITPATRWQQRRGIDRVFVGRLHGQRITMEYKVDSTAGRTGNAFVEVQVGDRCGWAVTCHADLLTYYVPGCRRGYIVRPAGIRAKLDDWREVYETRTIANSHYDAIGILVPLDELASIADRVITL